MGPADDARAVAESVLERERAELRRRVVELAGAFDELVAASVDSNADDEHDPEGATVAYERSRLAASVHAARDRLDEVEAALGRVEAGTYGVCERCGTGIGGERLVARPTARTCITCAARR